MINEQKVKQLYKVALYEQKEERMHRQIGRYYRKDYITKEILKSIFTGTMAYLFMSMLWIASRWQQLIEQMNQMDLKGLITPAVVAYIGFMALYMGATYLIYRGKYEEIQKLVEKYEDELQTLHGMYEEEKK